MPDVYSYLLVLMAFASVVFYVLGLVHCSCSFVSVYESVLLLVFVSVYICACPEMGGQVSTVLLAVCVFCAAGYR